MNTLLLVVLIVEAVFGIGFLIFPGTLLAQVGISGDAVLIAYVRLFGSAILSFAFLSWFARKSVDLGFKMGTIYTLFVYYLISSILLVVAQLSGLTNAMGWGVVALHVVLALWCGYFIVKK